MLRSARLHPSANFTIENAKQGAGVKNSAAREPGFVVCKVPPVLVRERARERYKIKRGNLSGRGAANSND